LLQQYSNLSFNTHTEGGSYRRVRENMTEK
jgi:hypothetical protein